MRSTLLRHAACAAVLFGCASTHALRAEYALDPVEHPEGIECFYECLRHGDEDARRSCLWFCEGVEVTETYEACAPGSPALCRSYPAREPLPAADDSVDDGGENIAGDIIGTILVGLIRSAVGADEDSESQDRDDVERRERRGSYRPKQAEKKTAPSRGPKPWRERRK